MDFIIKVLLSTWGLLLNSSVYILVGLMVSGLIRIFLSPESVANHLGRGRFKSVFKAAIIGIPLPLCSCGVLPAAVSLKKQGANNGATTAFLISTPESGVDSISISYALLDPILTVIRPVAAFVTAIAAGITENMLKPLNEKPATKFPAPGPPNIHVDGECCSSENNDNHHNFKTKLITGFRYSFTDVWNDLAGWFFVGLLVAGLITSLVPEEFIGRYLGGGLTSMLFMLVIGIPLYICATASTPVAAALIMKGVSPGTALVFLLAGPATNMTSLTVLTAIFGKRTSIIYLGTIMLFSVLFGLATDKIYAYMNISPQAVVGSASELLPFWLQLAGAIIILAMSLRALYQKMMASRKIRSTAL